MTKGNDSRAVESHLAMQQTCKVCGRPDYFDFTVPDDIWKAVVPETHWNRVVCMGCFDRLARENNVQYGGSIKAVYFAGEMASLQLRPI